MNHRGDIPSLIYAVLVIAALGIMLLFWNHFSDAFYTATDNAYGSGSLGVNYNNSVAQTTLQEINNAENSTYDYVFLFFAVGMILTLGIFAYSTRISVVFFWIYGIMAMIVMVIAVVMSTLWQSIAKNPEFATTITRFPITNAILDTYYPTFTLALVLLVMILLFGKPSEGR